MKTSKEEMVNPASTPLISVVIPCYNAELYIATTIDSVLKQTYSNFEIIIIDDGSTDSSKLIIENFKNQQLRYFYQENEGVSIARNKGLNISKGDYIIFLDADDLLHTDFMKDRLLALCNSYYIACASNVELINEKGDKLQKSTSYTAANKMSDIIGFNPKTATCPSSYLFNSSFLKKNSLLFNTNLQSSADKYFLLEVLSFGEIKIIASSPMYYRILRNSMSHKITINLMQDQVSYYKEVEKMFHQSNLISHSFYSQLCFTIAASSYYSNQYGVFLIYIFKSFFLSPRRMISLLYK